MADGAPSSQVPPFLGFAPVTGDYQLYVGTLLPHQRLSARSQDLIGYINSLFLES